MPNEKTENELLDAARAGDKSALETLLLRNQERVYRFGLKLCRNPTDAEDVLQDTLLAMARSIRDFQGKSTLSTWLYTVARNFCIKKRRKNAVSHTEIPIKQEGATLVALKSSSRTPEEIAAGGQLQRALERAIQSLEPEYREVLVLRDVEGLSAEEVSEVLDLSVPAIKSRLHRARLRVRELVAPLLSDETTDAPTWSACPDIALMYSQHLENEISSDLCAQMEKHITDCPRCRMTCDSVKRTLSLCRSAADHPVPIPVQESVRKALQEFLSAA